MAFSFSILLASHIIRIDTLYEDTKRMCKDYMTHDRAAPALTIKISPDDIAFEREKSRQEASFEGLKVIDYPDGYLETLAVYRKIAAGLLKYDILLFHGSAIAVDGAAYLFTARSGTGKSTHTRLWRERFGERAIMVNDDKPLLKITENGVSVFGTPWDGKHHLSRNVEVPLKSICILTRSETNQIEKVERKDAFSNVFQQTFRPADPEEMMKTLQLLDRLGEHVEFYRLGCNMDPEAADVAYEGMKQPEGDFEI